MKLFLRLCSIVAETTPEGKTYIWCNSNGQSSGSEYNNNLTFSRIEYISDHKYLEPYAGDTFAYTALHPETHSSYIDIQVSIDFVSRRILLGGRVLGLARRFFWVLPVTVQLHQATASKTY